MASDTDIKSNSEEQKTEEKAENKTIQSACDISINQIFTALHFKALEQANAVNPDIKIQNSAIEGEKESDAKFYGAGQHVIAAIPVKSGSVDETGITKKQALPVLQAYIQWFAGPDIKLNEDSLNAVPDSSVTDHKSDEKDNKKKSNESIYVPSFLQYLLLEAGEEADEEASSSEKDKEPDDKEPDDKKPSSEDDEKTKGWYITFKLDIKGQKSYPLADALKKLAKDLVDQLGFEVFDWRSGSGEMHTLGDVLDDLSKVFGKIDPNELQAKYDQNFKKKFPQSGAQSQIWDTKTINQHLKKVLDSKAKAKLKAAELALCTRVDKRDKSYKLYNSQAIADLVTASIQGLFKKFKNKVSKDDVIMVNNYSDDKKNKDDTQYTGDKETGAVADSLASYANGSLLVEASQHKAMSGEVRKELDALAKADLKKYKPSSTVGSTDKIIEMLKKAGIDEQKWFTELQNAKAKNCFMVKTVEPTSEKKDDVSASMRTSSSLLNLLFEKSLPKDTDVADKVKNLFRKLIDKFKDSANQKELKFDMVDSLVGHVTDKEMKESIAAQKSLSFMKVLYEDIDNNTTRQILEVSEEFDEVYKKIESTLLDADGNVDQDKVKRYVDALLKARDSKELNAKELFPNKGDKRGVTALTSKLLKAKSKDNIGDAFSEINGEEVLNKLLNIAKKANNAQTVYYVVPDENGILDAEQYKVAFYTVDLKNPDDKSKWKQFGEPQTISSPKDLKYPKDVPEEVDGRKFTGWNPTEKEFKSSAIDKYFADDKFTIEGNDGSKTIAIRAQYEDAENKLNTARTELDFYIVPMKGLSYNTRKSQKDDK